MAAINEQLFQILQEVQRPGDYYTSGKVEVFLPNLEVTGVGRIALPLLPVQAQQLVAIAEQAPYGRGQETLIDTEVRRTWQINTDQITLKGKHWEEHLNTIVQQCAAGLGVSGSVAAELYKLLVYDVGSFFVSHRDTEKTAGMFATLVIVLPSEYTGGELIIKHQEQEVKLDLSSEESCEIAFAAFYADCKHEVLPITQGCRLTLIYNLVRTDKKLPLPQPPDYRQEQTKVASLLREWAEALNATTTDTEIPKKLIYVLEHAYTSAELGFDALKNADAALADVLLAAAEQADCQIHLALVSIEESGTAEYSGSGSYWHNDDTEDDYEVGEVYDRIETISNWRHPDGQPSRLPVLPFSANEFCPLSMLDNLEFDDIEFQEATGNAGASFDRTYHRAALVIWPRAYYLAIINQAGLSATLPVLHELCQQWEAEDSTCWQNAHTLAGYMLRDWIPQYLENPNYTGVDDFLNYLYRLGDIQCIQAFWRLLSERGFYNKGSSSALTQTAELLPWSLVVDCVEQAIAASASKAMEANAALLNCLSSANPSGAKDLHKAAHSLFKVLPGDPERYAHLQPWERARISVSVPLITDVLTSFNAIDTTLADTLLSYLLAWPTVYGIDSIVIPAALQLIDTPACRELPFIPRLRTACVAHLHTRLILELVPPADWRRDSQINCTCKDCAEFRAFLDNPTQSMWRFKAAENRRDHIEQTIKYRKCDVNSVTEKSSRPYSLLCTKNQASYERRVEQRKTDLATLARFGC